MMDHVAVMKKKWKLVDKILNGTKTIESRWYKNKKKPWNCITKGDVVYFKEGLVRAKAIVDDVIFYDNLDYDKIKTIITKYHKQLGVNLDYADKVKDKRYCILVFLKNPEKIEEFDIDKRGFGNMCAWMVVEDVDSLRA
ncbi:hypothetical protein KY328_04410 [Candidatus Woesearchaeota archaeon]|nr:hypothetical protein [Candidatus Woesearchaeota archaeon]